MSTRDEIRELCIAHDKQMAEHREWLARREAQSASLARRNDNPAGLVFKTIENALVEAAEPEPAAVNGQDDEEPDDRTLLVALTDAVENRFDYEERQRHRLERELTFLKGQFDAVLTMLGKSETVSNSKAADVIDLPDWRKRSNVA